MKIVDLRKAHKLNYRVMHPGNNKQCVNLTLAVFDKTTMVTIRSYLPERKDMTGFLTLILKWWTIVDSPGLPQVLESPGKSWILKSVLESP